MPRTVLIEQVHKSLVFPQTVEKVISCLQTLLQRGLLEQASGVVDNGDDVQMQDEDQIMVKLVN